MDNSITIKQIEENLSQRIQSVESYFTRVLDALKNRPQTQYIRVRTEETKAELIVRRYVHKKLSQDPSALIDPIAFYDRLIQKISGELLNEGIQMFGAGIFIQDEIAQLCLSDVYLNTTNTENLSSRVSSQYIQLEKENQRLYKDIHSLKQKYEEVTLRATQNSAEVSALKSALDKAHAVLSEKIKEKEASLSVRSSETLESAHREEQIQVFNNHFPLSFDEVIHALSENGIVQPSLKGVTIKMRYLCSIVIPHNAEEIIETILENLDTEKESREKFWQFVLEAGRKNKILHDKDLIQDQDPVYWKEVFRIGIDPHISHQELMRAALRFKV